MEFNKKNIKIIICILFGGILFYEILENISNIFNIFSIIASIVAPFLIGGIIAFILNVPMVFFERKITECKKLKRIEKFKRSISLAITILSIFAVILIAVFLIIPQVVKTFTILKDNMPSYINNLQRFLNNLGIEGTEIQDYINSIDIDWYEIQKNVLNFIKNGAGSFFNSTFGVVSSIIGTVINFFIGFIFAIYILMQKEKLALQIKKILYSFFNRKIVERILKICKMCNETFSNFLSGQVIEAMILGILFFISMTIFRMPYALLIGVLIAITALIPIFGAFIGCILGAFLIVMVNPIQALWFIILFLVLQQIEGNFIYPHVVGNSVGLPSIWVLVAVTVGGSVMGVLGMILFIPLFSVIYSIIREVVNERIKENSIIE